MTRKNTYVAKIGFGLLLCVAWYLAAVPVMSFVGSNTYFGVQTALAQTYGGGTYGGGQFGGGSGDTTAPTLSMVTPVPTPSNDTTPSFTFSSNEAGTITYSGGCTSGQSSAVSGNNTITLNTLAAGTYASCQLRVADAAGNQSALLSIPSFTIDTTAPTLSLVTPVVTPTNDTTPSLTFSSSEAGPITYSGGCTASLTTAVSGNNSITLTALTAGTRSACRIRVTDAAGNQSALLAINTFTIDTTAPSLTLVTPVPTPSTDTTPSFTFSSSEAGTITYAGACTSAQTSAVSGNNTITLNTLAVGTYSNCQVRVTDAAGNQSTLLSITAFTIQSGTTPPDTTAPVLVLVTPVSTPATDTTPAFTFSSNEGGTISYAGSCVSSQTSAVTGNNTITLNTLAVGTYSNCQVRVTDAAGNQSIVLAIPAFTIEAASSGGGGGGGGGSSSGGGGSSSGGGSRVVTPSTPATPTTPVSSPATPIVDRTQIVTPQTATGRSSIPSSFRFRRNVSFIQPEFNYAEDVNNLKIFLNEFEGANLTVNGVYDSAANEAMKRFQQKYRREILDVWNLTEATGFVGITTRLKMNFLLQGQTAQCPAFTEFNGGLSGIMNSPEIGRTQDILRELGMYAGPTNNTWDAATNRAMIRFQETFREVMLDPWGITEGTGYKYKTTNIFLNYFAGCKSGPVMLEGVGEFQGI